MLTEEERNRTDERHSRRLRLCRYSVFAIRCILTFCKMLWVNNGGYQIYECRNKQIEWMNNEMITDAPLLHTHTHTPTHPPHTRPPVDNV